MPKRYLTGGGEPKNHYKSCCYPFKSLKNLKYFAKQLSKFLTLRREDKLLESKGSILIEFAVCMPILIILLFYINDLVKIKRMYSQMEFVGQQMVNILQNISKGQQITLQQMEYAAILAWQTVYPGKTIYCVNNDALRHHLFHWPWIKMYRIKGQSGGQAYCQWGQQYQLWDITSPSSRSSGTSSMYRSSITSSEKWSKINYNSSATAASNIYPSLKIGENDEKIILENTMYWRTDYHDANGKAAKNAKEVYNLHFAIPNDYPSYNNSAHTLGVYFPSVVIFTPKPGILTNAP